MTKARNIFLGSLIAGLLINTSPAFAACCGGFWSSATSAVDAGMHDAAAAGTQITAAAQQIEAVAQPLVVGELMAILNNLKPDGTIDFSNMSSFITPLNTALDTLTPPATATDLEAVTKRAAVSVVQKSFQTLLDDGNIRNIAPYMTIIQTNLQALMVPTPTTATDCATNMVLKFIESIMGDFENSGTLNGRTVIADLLTSLEPAPTDLSLTALATKGFLALVRTQVLK